MHMQEITVMFALVKSCTGLTYIARTRRCKKKVIGAIHEHMYGRTIRSEYSRQHNIKSNHNLKALSYEHEA